jgi:hypothetical protein
MKYILGALVVIAVTALFIWIKWLSLKSRVKDLGNGGIQTIFDNDSK